jgi:hypothetical protein
LSEISDRARAVGLGALATLLYLCTAPAVPNADGLGYLKLLPHNFAAGHLAFMPMLRTAARLLSDDGLRAGRLLDALLGGSGVVLLYGIARRALSFLPLGRPFSTEDIRFVATTSAAGLAVSYGYWIECADVEAYAAATVALLSTVRLSLAYRARPTAFRALATGALLGVSVLCHLSHVLLAPFVAATLYWHAPSKATRLYHPALALAVGGALSLGAYAYAALMVRGHDLHGALAWIATAQHGFRQPGGAYRLTDAIYGLAKSLVWSPYLYESDAQVLIGQFVLGLLPLTGAMALLIVRRRALPPPIIRDWREGVWWVAPYALLGMLFFGNDSERWIFVLPALWLAAATTIAFQAGRMRLALGVIAYLFVLNLSTAMWPAHKDAGGVRARAVEAGQRLSDGDLLIFPGHGWDEYVSFYAHAKVEPFPLSYYAARDGAGAAWARLDRDLEKARARGGRTVALRFFDEHDEDPRGFAELSAIGLDRAAVREELRKRSVLPIP